MTKFIFSTLFTLMASGMFQPALGYSITDEAYKWKKNSVSVCWASYENFMTIKAIKNEFGKKIKKFHLGLIDNKTRQKIHDKINQQYTLDSVGFEFTGWKTCDEAPESDIFIAAFQTTDYEFDEVDFLNADFPEGRARIGVSKTVKIKGDYETQVPLTENEKSFILLRKSADLNLSYPENNFLMVALHEFGHAAGLLHEHVRAESLKDENCLKYIGENRLKLFLEKRLMGYTYGNYDRESIMNYCYMAYLTHNWLSSESLVKLSSGDIHTLRCLYKPALEPVGTCSPQKIIKQ